MGDTIPQSRILVLDDERTIVELIAHHLREEGYQCDVSIEPREALDLIKNDAYGLLITDISMPDISGMDVVQQVKTLAPDMSIVVITAYTEVKNAIQALRLGADDYLLKPFNLGEISLSVSRALEKRTLVLENRMYQHDLEQRVEAATGDLQRINRELVNTKEYLENLLHSTVDGIITVDKSSKITFCNRGALRMLGYEESDILGALVSSICVGKSAEVEHVALLLKRNNILQSYETELLHKTGQLIPVNISLSYVRDADGVINSTLAIFKDISEQKRLEKELKEISIKDSLTGLFNQRYFYERLEAELERARRQKHPLSLLLFDVDQFKTYNDCHGHLEGDRVLQTIGQVVLVNTREHVDAGFRYGGDEFTVILPEADETQALVIAERIRKGFEDKHFDTLTLSVGLMTYQSGFSLQTFIRFTDNLMYGAKRSGGNRVYVYKPSNEEKGESSS